MWHDDGKPEKVIADRYRVERRIGLGLSSIVGAKDSLLKRRVAIRLLTPVGPDGGEHAARAFRRALLATRLTSEHVVRAFDSGVLEDGTFFIVMEFVSGSDLSCHVRRHGPLARDQAVDFLIQACDAVAEAHALGIVHRDIKPAKLFAAESPEGVCIKILDFDLALDRTASSAGNADAEERELEGTPLYMSPEQMRAEPDVDERADIWSLGMTLFELLTGKTLIEGNSMGEIYSAIVHDGPLRWSPEHHFDRETEPALTRCLRRKREDRYQSVVELVKALAPFAPERSKSLVERIVHRAQR
jgi:serine/threonine-protein kinase